MNRLFVHTLRLLLTALLALGGCGLASAAVAGLASAAVARASGESGVLVIDGAGFGHGIGMSQYGAAGYALHGRDYRFILAHYYSATGIGQVNPARIVKVLLESSGAPSFSGADATPGLRLPHGRRLSPATTYTVSATPGGELMLSFRQRGRERLIGPLRSPLTVTGGGPLALAGVGEYAGELVFSAAGAGVQTVNAVDLEDYVRGVVTEEMPAGWPAQALEAQAVAARTFAITNDVAGGDFDLYADTRSQMYGGVTGETPAGNAAVAATRGQVVTYHGQPVSTYYFSSSGGHTESIQDEWPGASPEPWLIGVSDPYDAAESDPYHRWTLRVSLATVQRLLAQFLRGKGSFVGIDVLQHGTSPRVIWAMVRGTRGSSRVSGLQLQQIFGLYSNWASFTTITSQPESGVSSGGAGAGARLPAVSPALAALREVIGALRFGRARTLVRGRVFPAMRGSRIIVQKWRHGRWRRLAAARVTSDGGYQALLPGRGTYRVCYRGQPGLPFTIR